MLSLRTHADLLPNAVHAHPPTRSDTKLLSNDLGDHHLSLGAHLDGSCWSHTGKYNRDEKPGEGVALIPGETLNPRGVCQLQRIGCCVGRPYPNRTTRF